MDDGARWVRDVAAAVLVAAAGTAVVWTLPFAGVPILGLIGAPVALVTTGAWSLSPLLLVDGERPLRASLVGAALLAIGGQLAALDAWWAAGAAQAAALAWSRGQAGALVPLLWPALALLLPFGSLLGGLLLARRIRVGAAVLVAAGLVSVAPAAANTLLVAAWLGLPLSA